ncbi:MAG: hypothetical protein Q8O30_09315 [Candidatus Omnitrophota bacterium]|nr:hypothetical protein [Candidatus Omnitrophota bacterium]
MLSPLKQKILLLLYSGLALGFTYNPRRQWYVLKSAAREWRKIEANQLRGQINDLYRSKLIKKEKNKDGSCTLILTDKGKLKVLTYNLDKTKRKYGDWDNKWRMVAFDVPERMRSSRNVLRDRLKYVGFYELQKSVFVFPYDCRDEIEFIVEFYNLRKYVRFAVLDSIDNELHLKSLFKLI